MFVYFPTTYATFIIYNIEGSSNNIPRRFKVYNEYKLKLDSYGKNRFDPFCRWDRINIPYTNGKFIETTIGQLNFFKWAIENNIIDFIKANYSDIEGDMNNRNSTAKRYDDNDNTNIAIKTIDENFIFLNFRNRKKKERKVH